MKPDESWVLFKAEASGMRRPLQVVEIAAQTMRGYAPEGTRFRVLLNHGVPLGPESQALHGYTEEYLRQHGQDPALAHSLFRDYVGSRPVVSYNLPMNWDRLLVPECQRLGLSLPGVRGFCALTLARRVLPEMSSYALSKLNRQYRLVQGDLRGAAPDVEAVAKLFQNWLGPRLTAADIQGFATVAEFSRQTPPAKCRERIEKAAKELALPAPPVTVSVSPSPAGSLAEFKELVEEIMADGVMTTPEFLILMDWLRDCPHTDVYPLDRLWEGVQQVTASAGEVSPEDQVRLEKALRYYLETGEAPPRPEDEHLESEQGTQGGV